MHLVVVIPALNEESTVEGVVRRVPRKLEGIDRVDVLVVDDGSSDTTADRARHGGAFCIRHPLNRGLGAAFQTGLNGALLAGADLVVNMDADGQFRPEDIPELVKPILTQGYGFVTCTRFGNPELVPQMPWLKHKGNGWVCWLVNWIIRGRFSDVSCGFRAYSRDTLLRLVLHSRFTYTQESFINLASIGIAMTEIPLVVRGEREFGKSRMADNLWKFATQISMIMLRSLRDTRPLTFFGLMALFLSLLGVGQIGWVAVHWLGTGSTSPWKSLLSTGAIFIGLGGAMGVVALLADQIGRARRSLEEVLYLQRVRHFQENRSSLESWALAPHAEPE